jgi:HlyD family secretion protein
VSHGAAFGPLRTLACLSVFLLSLWAARPADLQAAPPGPSSKPVKVAEIFQDRLNVERAFVGSVIPTDVSQVGSTVESRVVEMFVEAGDRVQKGDKLAQLRTQTTQIQLEMAKAELELLDHELQRLKISLPKQLDQAKARMLAAEALKKFTNARLARSKSLSSDQIISKDELEEILSAATGALKIFEERTIGLELAKATFAIDISLAEAKLKVQEEKISRLEDDIAEHTILAPFDGYVTEEYTEVGQWIAKGDPVVEVIEINEDNEIEIQIPVLESYISHLKVRGPDSASGTKTLRIEVQALPGEEFSGQIVSIVPKADIKARTFPVKIRLKNRQGRNGMLLKPGMLARVTLPVTKVLNATLVPKDALVLAEGKATIIWVLRKGADFGTTAVAGAVPVAVQIGEPRGNWIQVRPIDKKMQALLKPGGLVITEGNERINPALPVRVIETLKHDKP